MVSTAPASPPIRAFFLRDGRARTVATPSAAITRNHSLGKIVFAAVSQASPALFAAWFILHYGIDTPWGDQWDGMAQLFEKMQVGTLGLSDFFAFHNEHRIFFPRLLSFALARLTHWNIRAEMMLVWVLLCVCALNVCGLARATGWRKSRRHSLFFLAANILLFSILQWENLLWGFQIGFVFPLATITASLWAAVALRRPFDFAATMLLCLMTTFSIASGFASWFLTAPLLLLSLGKKRSRADKVWWLIWLAVALISIWGYFQGFARPRNHPSEGHALAHPIFALQFFLAYLGSPFATGTFLRAAVLAPFLGGILLFALLVCLIALWRARADKILLERTLPWFALAGISLTSSALTTIGRAGFGISAALPPRYVSFAIMLPIALLFLVPVLVRQWQARAAFAIPAIAFALLFIAGSVHCFSYLPAFQHRLREAKAIVQLSSLLDEPAALKRYVHWMGPALRPRINVLDQLGYVHPPLVRSRKLSEIAASTGEEDFGQLTNLARNESGDFTAGGWAILPSQNRVADSVLLAYENQDGEWILFARVDVGLPLADARKSYEYAGWIASWKAETLPAETRRVSAWAFDAEAGRAYRIGATTL